MSRSGPIGFSIGAAATLVAVLFLLAVRLYLGVPTPFELAVDLLLPKLPMDWFEAGISALGGLAKPLLYAGLVLAAILCGGLLGIAYMRIRKVWSHLSRSHRILLSFIILTSPIALTLLLVTGKGWFDGRSEVGLVVIICSYGAGWLLFVITLLLVDNLRQTSHGPEYWDQSRRYMLRQALSSGGMFVAALAFGPMLIRLSQRITLTDLQADATGMPVPLTPSENFYIVSKNLFDPQLSADNWQLSLAGMMDRPCKLTLEELRAMPAAEQMQTLECISNPVGGNLISNARWKGVPLRDLLRRAGVRNGALDIKLTSVDGYTESIPLEKAMEPVVLVAYEMNGEPLTTQHGAPARLLVPGIYGIKNSKWLHRIEAVSEDYKGYWQKQGWTDRGTIQTMSQIRVPSPKEQIRRGQVVTVKGIAFAGSRGVRKVEWSADGEQVWHEAQLHPQMTPFSWRLWETTWVPTKVGPVRLVVRATDGDGEVQTSERTDTLPNGATGYHSITVEVV